ncbi:MAG TPA: GspE/PulE family protein [Candidatus Bathyarchaeia archaeon]|nr:GspE/PulE family protein [Candidatus Bathyarchaeia archaeon]
MVNLRCIEREPERSEPPKGFAEIEAELAGLVESGDDGAIKVVDAALGHAGAHNASDIHIEPWRDTTSVRFRIDGILHDVARLPRAHHEKIAGRVKILARIISYVKDTPQDGRIEPDATPCGTALRVSTFPTVEGEKIVIRVLDLDHSLLVLDALGFDEQTVDTLRGIIMRPSGTILLTGPASSGKTTTIYSLLNEILLRRKPAPHTVTVEDPVECRLARISQSQVNVHAGFTYEAALKALLRQDPEVIMLGEIRDPETARAAIQAGLTGHLVISTVHSGTAAGVFARLLDMGVEPYLVASSITGVLAQRLLRRTCPDCALPYPPDPALAAGLGLAVSGEGQPISNTAVNIPATPLFTRGAGCPACLNIGYRGRFAVGELLLVNEQISNLLLTHPRTSDLHNAALDAPMRPLWQDAAGRVAAGQTTVEEVTRVIGPNPREAK